MLRIQIINRQMRKRIITKAKRVVPAVASKRRKSTPQNASSLKSKKDDYLSGNGAFNREG